MDADVERKEMKEHLIESNSETRTLELLLAVHFFAFFFLKIALCIV